MRTYTTQEAAELTGSSVRALRKRIERGQLRAVQHGRYWRIPHAELERLELIGPEGTAKGPTAEGADGPDVILLEHERERAERQRLTQELARLRPLPAQIEQVTANLHRERAERLAAEAKTVETESIIQQLRDTEQALAHAGFFERRRLLRELRERAGA